MGARLVSALVSQVTLAHPASVLRAQTTALGMERAVRTGTLLTTGLLLKLSRCIIRAQSDHTELFREIYFASYDDAWDSDKHYGCKCDKGYRGPSCALVECPSDKDPLDDKCDMATVDASKITDFQLQYDAPFGASGWEDAYSAVTGPAGDGSEQATLQNSDYNRHYILDDN